MLAPDVLEGEHGSVLPLSSHSVVYEAARVVKTGDGTLFSFHVYNSKLSAQFVQLFDASALPADGAVPLAFWTLATVAQLDVSYSTHGRSFWQGIILCNSSTGPTKTIGAADCWFDAIYL